MNQNFDQCNGMIHVVEKGDTLYNLSKIYNVPLGKIITANPYVNVYNMQEGEEVCIPVKVPKPEPVIEYTVAEGDDFGFILNKFKTTPDKLFATNEVLYEIPLPEGLKLKK
jgi:LysM repeat protein